MPDTPERGSNRVYVIRKRLGLDQEKMGEELGVTRAYVSGLENGHYPISKQTARTLDHLEAIADAKEAESEKGGDHAAA